MKMTRTNIKIFRLNFANAVKSIEKLHGIKIDLGNITFNDSSLRSKIEVTNIDSSLNNVEQAQFESQCKRFGFNKSDYNKKVRMSNGLYSFVGFKPSNTKYPCIVENGRGKYKMTKLQVSNNLV